MISGRKSIIIGIIITAIAILIGIYAGSPLFVNTTVNEPLPTSSNVESGKSEAMQQYEEFMAMTEEERMQQGQMMSPEKKEVIMRAAAETNDTASNEQMPEQMSEPITISAGRFIGVNDGVHNAEGIAKIITLQDGSHIVRLEDFRSTNGPDLYVYLSTDKGNSDFVGLGRLKGNVGNQNYEIPEGTDLSKYDNVLIWCQAFSVLFGSAELK